MTLEFALSLENAGVRYGGNRVLQPTTVAVNRGELVSILGPSGSGKTTLLNLIAGFVQSADGRIFIKGRDVTHLPPRARNCGVVFQSYALFPHMSVRENVAYGLQARGIREPELRSRVDEMLHLVRLTEYSDRSVLQLSGGQRQRVAVARALVIKPDLVLMDEPLAALDRSLRREVQREIRKYHVALGETTLFITHDQEEALALSDRIILLNAGQIVQMGTPQDLYEEPLTLFAATFFGESSQLAGTTDRDARPGEEIPISLAHGLGITRARAASRLNRGDRCVLVLRPERLRFQSPEEGGTGLRGRIVQRRYGANAYHYDVEIGDGVAVKGQETLASVRAIGEAVSLVYDKDLPKAYVSHVDVDENGKGA
jgi:ABC-type Fe3+/spermidine/putrescine transport system ATPase subunit